MINAGLIRLFKADPLRKGKVGTVVDRDSLPAHVGLPGIAATFTTAAGLFLASKCSSDLGSAGAKVYVRYTAVTPPVRNEFFCLRNIGRKIAELSPCGTRLWISIASSNSLYEKT